MNFIQALRAPFAGRTQPCQTTMRDSDLRHFHPVLASIHQSIYQVKAMISSMTRRHLITTVAILGLCMEFELPAVAATFKNGRDLTG